MVVRAGERLVGLLAGLLTAALVINTLLLVGELLSMPATRDVALAERLISHGRFAPAFWGGVVGVGTILPLILLVGTRAWTGGAPVTAGVAAGPILAALIVHEVMYIKAGQAVPLS
ncbi:MAG: hypothetical protein ACHQ7N_21290 [Candidatus Methylomirabilales bacterium]